MNYGVIKEIKNVSGEKIGETQILFGTTKNEAELFMRTNKPKPLICDGEIAFYISYKLQEKS